VSETQGAFLPPVIPSPGKIKFRDILLAALPGCIIVAICLSFFLNDAFTIDDTIFLRTAEQATRTPAHPFAFDMCWDSDGKVKRFSQFVANAPLMGYVLVPVVHSSSPEVNGHILQILILCAGILATASLALRLGLSRGWATLVATLTATCPAVLGMASTVMPDILAMTLGAIAVDRFIAWRQEHRWWDAALAVTALALAPLARPHLALMLPVCALLCVPSLSRVELRKEWRSMLPGFLLVGLATTLMLGIAFYTRDPAAGGVMIHSGLVRTAAITIGRHALSLGTYLALTSPFIAGLMIFAVRQQAWRIAAIALLGIPLAIGFGRHDARWSMLGCSLVAYVALAWLLPRLWNLHTGVGLAFLLWVLFPFAMVVYLHMVAKYLVPSVPAYALLLAFMARNAGRVSRWTLAALPIPALIFGMMIVSADRNAADLARLAVNQWVPALESRGHRVLFFGQWGFQWYAELQGAACFDPGSANSARPGDYVIVDAIGAMAPFPQSLYPNGHLVSVISNTRPSGIVLDNKRKVGFYSDAFGRLPWWWVPPGTLRFELWQIQ
jgi:hypothetical protein